MPYQIRYLAKIILLYKHKITCSSKKKCLYVYAKNNEMGAIHLFID